MSSSSSLLLSFLSQHQMKVTANTTTTTTRETWRWGYVDGGCANEAARRCRHDSLRAKNSGVRCHARCVVIH